MRHDPMVSGNRCTELVIWTGLDGSLPYCDLDADGVGSQEADRPSTLWNVGKLVPIQQVGGISWDRVDYEPRQLGSLEP
jgi:hypothetical protein